MTSNKYLLLSLEEWTTLVAVAAVSAVACYPWYEAVSLWIGPVIAAMVVVVSHMVVSANVLPPFLHISAIFGGIQLILVAWFAFYYPTLNPAYDVGARTPEYLTYGAPAWLIFTAGLFVPFAGLFRMQRAAVRIPSQGRRELLWEFDMLLFGGILFSIVSAYVTVTGFDFVLLLFANLRFVGGLGWILSGAKGWKVRTVVLMAMELLAASTSGMFGTLALWGAFIVAVTLYRHCTRKTTVALVLFGMCVALPALETAKLRIREKAWFADAAADPVFGMEIPWTGMNRPLLCVLYILEGITRTLTLSLSAQEVSHLSARHNHAWIVNRVMVTVPEVEPYARGETLLTAMKSAVLPRILFPDKYTAGGQNFERFTGHVIKSTLTGEKTASMNLGFAGEFYANFGKHGGIAGCGIYGLFLGLLFRWFIRKAFVSSLWWSIFPYVFFFAMKSEEGMGEVINWIVKSSLLLFGVLLLFPAIRGELTGRRRSETGVIILNQVS